MRRPVRHTTVAVSLAAAAGIWSVLSLMLRHPALPPPWDVAAWLARHGAQTLLPHALASLGRVLAGVCCAAAAGTVCALIQILFPAADAVVHPMLCLVTPIPKIALLPVLLLLFGLGEGGKWLLLFLICVFPFALSARDAFASLRGELRDVSQTLGATRRQEARYLYLPAALPALLSGLRTCFGSAFSALFFAESFGRQFGLGSFILDAWLRVSYAEMYAGILALALLGLGLSALTDRVCARILAGR